MQTWAGTSIKHHTPWCRQGTGAFLVRDLISLSQFTFNFMTSLDRTALYCFIATSFLATATIMIGYGVNNWMDATNERLEARYELPTTPATGEYTAY